VTTRRCSGKVGHCDVAELAECLSAHSNASAGDKFENTAQQKCGAARFAINRRCDLIAIGAEVSTNRHVVAGSKLVERRTPVDVRRTSDVDALTKNLNAGVRDIYGLNRACSDPFEIQR